MYERTNTRKLILAGLFVALGLIIPYFTGHAFGVPGTILLPMHLPVLLCGLLCGPKLGALCGVVTPLLSSVLTGMPPMYPMLPVMMGELITYGFVSGFLRETLKKPVLLSQIGAMVAGRVVYGLIFAALVFANPVLRAPSVLVAVSTGLPGIVIQLLAITPIVLFVEKMWKQSVTPRVFEGEAFAEAKRLIAAPGTSVVMIRDGRIIHQADGRGVKPLLEAYENQPEVLNGSLVVDTLIGKAAAMILVLGGVHSVHGTTMSEAGAEYLKKRGIPLSYDRKIELISNREGTGVCPLERSVMELDDPKEGYEKLKETVCQLRKAQ